LFIDQQDANKILFRIRILDYSGKIHVDRILAGKARIVSPEKNLVFLKSRPNSYCYIKKRLLPELQDEKEPWLIGQENKNLERIDQECRLVSVLMISL